MCDLCKKKDEEIEKLNRMIVEMGRASDSLQRDLLDIARGSLAVRAEEDEKRLFVVTSTSQLENPKKYMHYARA